MYITNVDYPIWRFKLLVEKLGQKIYQDHPKFLLSHGHRGHGIKTLDTGKIHSPFLPGKDMVVRFMSLAFGDIYTGH